MCRSVTVAELPRAVRATGADAGWGREAVAEQRSLSAGLWLPADPESIFGLLTDITVHAVIDGSGTLQGAAIGPRRLTLDSEFTMGMRQARVLRPYRSLNRVVEFDQGHRIAWESMGVWRGHKIVGGQRWRWVLRPARGGTWVVHSYVWGYASLALVTVWLPGYPARARHTLPRSLDRLAALVGPGPRAPRPLPAPDR